MDDDSRQFKNNYEQPIVMYMNKRIDRQINIITAQGKSINMGLKLKTLILGPMLRFDLHKVNWQSLELLIC